MNKRATQLLDEGRAALADKLRELERNGLTLEDVPRECDHCGVVKPMREMHILDLRATRKRTLDYVICCSREHAERAARYWRPDGEKIVSGNGVPARRGHGFVKGS